MLNYQRVDEVRCVDSTYFLHSTAFLMVQGTPDQSKGIVAVLIWGEETRPGRNGLGSPQAIPGLNWCTYNPIKSQIFLACCWVFQWFGLRFWGKHNKLSFSHVVHAWSSCQGTFKASTRYMFSKCPGKTRPKCLGIAGDAPTRHILAAKRCRRSWTSGNSRGKIIILEMFFWRVTIVYWHEHNLDVWLAHPQQFLELRLESVVKTPCQVNQDTTNCPPERHAPCRLPRVETCQALEIIAKLRTYGARSDGGYIVHCTSSKLHTHTHIYIYISHIFDQYCSII